MVYHEDVDGEAYGETSAKSAGESAHDYRETPAASGWTTTKQAAKVLEVSRRSVQGYVRQGLLEAKTEGDGVNKTFLISIDSLNTLRDRRRRKADEAANFPEGSPRVGELANLALNTGEGLPHVIARLEARTAEATELRIRLELTERAESTLREELEEERRRREEAERDHDELRRWLESAQEPRGSPETPSRARETEDSRSGDEGAPQRPSSPLSRRPVALWVIGTCLALVLVAVIAFAVTLLLTSVADVNLPW
jgi:hypothetical protein